jgi:hypothetical protein
MVLCIDDFGETEVLNCLEIYIRLVWQIRGFCFVKGKGYPVTGHEVPGRSRGIALLFL